MDITAELIESFQLFGNLSGQILEKCIELCSAYDITPEDLANQWGAFSASNLNASSLNVEALERMERKEFGRRQRDIVAQKKVFIPSTTKLQKTLPEEIDEDVIIMNYSTPKSTKIATKRVRSPEEETKQQFQPKSLAFSPGSYSSPISNYETRTDSGSILLSFGPKSILEKAFKHSSECTISVKPLEQEPLTAECRYMYEVMNKKVTSLNRMVEWIGQALIKKYDLSHPQPVTKGSGTLVTYGRICCDAEGKLNTASILLESTQELGRGSAVHLNLSKLASYGIFPGQTVAVDGFSSNGNVLIAHKLYADVTPEMPLMKDYPLTFQEPIQIIIAAGPFTLSDNLTYQPLQDLIKHIVTNPPHIVLLLGPFIDVSHESVYDITMAESFDNFFETLVECIMKPLEGLNVQVVLIASHKDAHHHIIFPTPPYALRKKYPNLQCVSDPTILNIEGLILGATSVDILLHLGKEEICSSSYGGDRISRLASYILQQRNFYPLYPPDEEICIDHQLLEQHAIMDVLPHILIVPSSLRYFVKNIDGCIVINPERLSKGYVAGSFGRIQIFPSNDESLNNNVVAQIVRI